MINCKICGSKTTYLFSKKVLNKYDAEYHRCGNCDFIQTSEPVWLKEAYDSAITKLDIGLLARNQQMRDQVIPILDACFPEAKIMLDFAGGYGVFTRMMRDAGFNFYRQDIYCNNIFAEKFDITDIKQKRFDVVTAFEVFEHFADPFNEIKALFDYSDNLIFSTELHDYAEQKLEDWWYITPETGQHIAFYGVKTLEYIAGRFGKKVYTKNKNLHVITSKSLSQQQADYAFRNIRYYKKWFGLKTEFLNFGKEHQSLLWNDFEYIKSTL